MQGKLGEDECEREEKLKTLGGGCESLAVACEGGWLGLNLMGEMG